MTDQKKDLPLTADESELLGDKKPMKLDLVDVDIVKSKSDLDLDLKLDDLVYVTPTKASKNNQNTTENNDRQLNAHDLFHDNRLKVFLRRSRIHFQSSPRLRYITYFSILALIAYAFLPDPSNPLSWSQDSSDSVLESEAPEVLSEKEQAVVLKELIDEEETQHKLFQQKITVPGSVLQKAANTEAVKNEMKINRTENEAAIEAVIIQEAANKEAAKKEAIKKEAAKKEAANKEAIKKEAIKKEAIKKEAIKKEAAKKEAAKKEAAKKEAAKKEADKREADKREATKEELAKIKAAKKEAAKLGVLQKAIAKEELTQSILQNDEASVVQKVALLMQETLDDAAAFGRNASYLKKKQHDLSSLGQLHKLTNEQYYLDQFIATDKQVVVLKEKLDSVSVNYVKKLENICVNQQKVTQAAIKLLNNQYLNNVKIEKISLDFFLKRLNDCSTANNYTGESVDNLTSSYYIYMQNQLTN